jgi:hypothetical protein
MLQQPNFQSEAGQMKQECEHLFCFKPATARITTPRHAPRQFICEGHLQKVLKWAEPYRRTPGRVVVERV